MTEPQHSETTGFKITGGSEYPFIDPDKLPWQGLTDGDWEWVEDKKETSLDTFAQGAAWAANRLKEKNT